MGREVEVEKVRGSTTTTTITNRRARERREGDNHFDVSSGQVYKYAFGRLVHCYRQAGRPWWPTNSSGHPRMPLLVLLMDGVGCCEVRIPRG